MSDDRSDRSNQIWQRVRRAILDVVHAVLGPPPPDVVQKIDDVLREAKQDWEKERNRCRDDETL
jgi:hypothetical protein